MNPATTLRKARTAARLTQRALSTASGVTQPRIAAYEKGRVVPTVQTLERLLSACRLRPSQVLERHRQEVLELIGSVGGRDVRVFGSVALGIDQAGSDVDLLVRLPNGMGLFELVALEQGLEDLLGVDVDVIDDHGHGPVVETARAQAARL